MHQTYCRWARRGVLAGGVALLTAAAGFGTSAAAAPVPVAPTLFVGDAAIAEGDLGSHVAKIPVTLSAPMASTTYFEVQTLDDGKSGATPLVDYKPMDTRKKLRAGATSMTVSVRIFGDVTPEGLEQVAIRLTPLEGAPVAMVKSTGSAVIFDDDATAASVLSASAARVFEGDSGQRAARVALTMPEPQSNDVTVTWKTEQDSASPDSDYKPLSGTTVIKAGKTQRYVNVPILGDTTDESHEQMHVAIVGVTGGSGLSVDPAPNSGLIVIVNDDGDADNDGLVDVAEDFIKTDSTNADTDGDGITDGYEVRVSFTNPKQADSDNDGFDDLVELKAGTNPLDAADHPFVDQA
jgi:hypothetical protein